MGFEFELSTKTLPYIQMTSNALPEQAVAERKSPKKVGDPFISVIIPVRNEEQYIEATLNCLLRQRYDPRHFELLVVDGESTDRTRELVEAVAGRHANVRLLHNPHGWSSAARNIGVRAARGDLMVIVDGHCEIDDERFLHNIAAAFESSGADCLGRPQPLDASEATPVQRAIAAARSSRLGHHPDSFIYSREARFVPAGSVAVAYRRSVFEQVGYFDETFDACEDYEFNYRIDKAGLRCFFTPDIAVKYVPRGTLQKLFGQLFRYGRGRVRLLRKYPNTFSLGTFLPAVWVLGLIGGMLLSIFSAWLAIVYLGTLSFYGLAVLLSTLSIVLRERNVRLAPWLPPVFIIIHIAAGMGVLAELLTGSRKLHSQCRHQ